MCEKFHNYLLRNDVSLENRKSDNNKKKKKNASGSKKCQFSTTSLSFDAPYPANPHEYWDNPYIITN